MTIQRCPETRDEGVEHSQFMIEPRAGETDRQDQWNGQVPERLVEIRAVLFGDLVEDVGGQACANGGRDGVEIADDGREVSGPPRLRSPPRLSTATRTGASASAACRSDGRNAPPPTSVTADVPRHDGPRSGGFFLVVHGDNLHRMALFPSRFFLEINFVRATAK